MANSHSRRNNTLGTRITSMQEDIDTLKKKSKTAAPSTTDTARIEDLNREIDIASSPALLLQQIIPDLDSRYAQSGSSSPLATTETPGIVELATTPEVWAATDNTRVVTVAQLLEGFKEFGVRTGRAGNAANTDWDQAFDTGFYWGSPPTSFPGSPSNLLVGHVYKIGSTNETHTGGDALGSIQAMWEFNIGTGVLVDSWRRVSVDGFIWSSWVSDTELVAQATTTKRGTVELATDAEALSGTDTERAVTPHGLKTVADTKAPANHTHTHTAITDFDVAVTDLIPDATKTQAGIIEIATQAEALTGIDDSRAMTPAMVRAVNNALSDQLVQDIGEDITAVDVKSQQALDAVGAAISTSIDEYFVTNSSTTPPPPNAAWDSDTPDWNPGEFVWRRTKYTTIAGATYYGSPVVVTGNDGTPGEDAVFLRIDSTNGTVFKNSAISTVLRVEIFKGTSRIVNLDDLDAILGPGYYLEWSWRRYDDTDFGIISSSDGRLSQGGFALTVSPADVNEKTVFQCTLRY